MARCPWPTALLLVLAAARALPARGDEPLNRAALPGESTSTARRLRAADKLADEKQFAEAADEYARVLDEAGGDLVPLDDRLSLRARWLVHQRLAALPPDLLRAYRNRVDNQAKKWLDLGLAARDVRPLRRAVEEAFCSRHAEPALELLGDLALERGEFPEAERWWRLLARPASEAARPAPAPPWTKADGSPDLDLVFPDPQGDVARYRAKQIVARLFAGERAAAAKELASFRGLHAKAQGSLAGRKGNYADLLQALADRPPVVPPAAADEWPTFAGDGSHQRLLPAEPADPNRLIRLRGDGPAWRFRPRHVPCYPVIAGNHVLVADARGVTAYDIDTGRARDWDLARDGKARDVAPSSEEARPTLTVADGRVYARLGAEAPGPERKPGDLESYLVCLELSGDGPRAVWVRKAGDGDAASGPRLYEGAPLVRDGLLYVAVTRFAGNQAVTAVECHAADRDGAAPLWSQDVVAARDESPREARPRHLLLTAAGPNVVCGTHSGAVVALDALTGRRAWAARYPSGAQTRPGGARVPHDLVPCLYDGVRVYAAPSDCDDLLCLDPMTGRLLWRREGVEVLHLLGVVGGRVLVTTRTGLRALSAGDGSDAGGWVKPDVILNDVGLPSAGRGFLAGDLVFWPTVDGVKVLRQEDGNEPEDLIRLQRDVLPPGNLAYAEGILAVCAAKELFIYLAPSRQLPRLEGAAREQAADAAAQYRLALAEADAGLYDRADATFRRAGMLAGEKGRLREATLRGRHEALLARAEAARRQGRFDEAGTLLDTAAAKEFPASARRESLARRAALAAEAGQPEGARVAWRAVLDDAALRRGTLRDRHGLPQGAGVLAAEALGLPRRNRATPAAPAAAEPDLTPPLFRAWETLAGVEERFLPLAHGPPRTHDLAVFARAGVLVCRDTAGGKERWASPLFHAATWAGRDADLLLVAGPDAVSAFTSDDGRPLWDWHAPESSLLSDARLSGFQLVGPRLFCLQGGARLLALDTVTGRVLWQEWAPSARLSASLPNARFSPHYLAAGDRVLVQAPGRGRVLDAATGRRLSEFATGAESWSAPPLPLDEQRVGCVADPRRVVALDLASGKPVWERALPRPASLTGEMPRLASGAGAVVVFLPRNHATTLQRLDPETGAALWADEALVAPERVPAEAAVVDGESVCYAVGGLLTARALRDGRVKWRRALPGTAGDWRLVRTASTLVALPASAPRAKVYSRWPLAALELAVTAPPEERPGYGIPVLLFDPASGELLQRLNLAAPRPRPEARLTLGDEAVRVPWQARREPAPEARPTMQFTRSGAVIAWEGKAWAVRRSDGSDTNGATP